MESARPTIAGHVRSLIENAASINPSRPRALQRADPDHSGEAGKSWTLPSKMDRTWRTASVRRFAGCCALSNPCLAAWCHPGNRHLCGI